MSPEKGLIQISKDDLKLDNDPYENIENDSPLSNMINLEEDFKLNHKACTFELPIIAIVATDGCFGYYSTPMHFEFHLLNSLMQSNVEEEFKNKLIDELGRVSGDDFSLSLTSIQTIEFLKFKGIV
ncbi:MAG: hypothetical protein IPJ13_26350 [Saprospiraceae bacterium]|nr:hypothetical protein [Saprospiraceae bacterium]